MPMKVSQAWVERDELILLLDGLDEVGDKERRDACVEAIRSGKNGYALTQGPHLHAVR